MHKFNILFYIKVGPGKQLALSTSASLSALGWGGERRVNSHGNGDTGFSRMRQEATVNANDSAGGTQGAEGARPGVANAPCRVGGKVTSMRLGWGAQSSEEA